MAVPTATYRLQLTPDFGFDAVLERFDHIRRLRVSHLYLSPVAQAVPESLHGYDVVDPTVVRAEFGGAAGLERLLDAAAEVGLGVVFDHVPNHLSIARPDLNRWWWETLRDGSTSAGARWFDIDWEANPDRVILPILGQPALTPESVAVEHIDGGVELVVHGTRRLPVRSGTEHLAFDELIAAQHYELVWWRDPRRNMRRFMTVDDLAGIRVEDHEVADIVNTLPRRYCTHPAFAGVRLDHIDGLADPTGYLTRLREQIGPEPFIWVEKMLVPGEELPSVWPVSGTTGYDFMRSLDPMLLDRDSEAAFTDAWLTWSDDQRNAREIDAAARVEVFDDGLAPDAARVRRVAEHELPTIDREALAAEMAAISTTLPRYRTYLPDAGAEVLASLPHGPLGDAILSGAAPHTRTRWQQLTGPVFAKGAEDRAVYRYLRLIALCEVGGDPGTFGHSIDTFHASNQHRAMVWPSTMNAGSTHDTKRSEDVRDRSLAMTWIPDEALAEAAQVVPALAERLQLDPTVVWLGWQTQAATPHLSIERFVNFLVKATREAERFTSWAEPNENFEQRLGELAAHLSTATSATKATLDTLGPLVALEATVLRLLSPGIPDIYQGTETWAYQLVDPDNRIPPDWDAVTDELRDAVENELSIADLWAAADPAVKPMLVRSLLDLRRRLPDSFGSAGSYTPLEAGEGAVAFVRGHGGTEVDSEVNGDDTAQVIVAARRGLAKVADDDVIELPAGRWFDTLDPSSPSLHGTVAVASLVGTGQELTMPIAVLERD